MFLMYLFSTLEPCRLLESPCKSVDICCISGHGVLPITIEPLEIPFTTVVTIAYTTYYQQSYPLNYAGDIFQPPKA